jgi:hypothetical protein
VAMPLPAREARRTLRFTPAKATMVRPGPGIAVRQATTARQATIARQAAVSRPPTVAVRTPAPLVRAPARIPTPARAALVARAVPIAPLVGAGPGLFGWMTAQKALTAMVALLVASATVGIAAVVFGQSFTATPTTRTSPVAFASGDDITSLDTLDFADAPVIGASGATASITIYGIPGATSLALGEILELVNADTADNTNYAVTLSVSGSPAATLTGFTITFLDDVSGTPTLRTWNLLTTPTLTTYTLSDAETWEFTVSSLVMTAAASGSQGALTITASMTPV